MATTPNSPVKDPAGSVSESGPEPSPTTATVNPPTPLPPPKPENPNPTPSPVKTEPPPSDATPIPTPTPAASTTTTTTTSRPPESPAATEPTVDIVHIPSYSRWFSWNNVHDCEVRFLPEFFYGRSPSKNPRVYMYYRNEIIKLYRQNPLRKITFTDARKTIIGDVGSVRRVFDFLETWGLVNYSGSVTKPLKWDDKETSKSGAAGSGGVGGGNAAVQSGSTKEKAKRVCNGCKSVCSIACFACDKYDLTLCARCYVRGNYRVGVSSSDFRRVEINDDTKADWTEKETLHLLEALMHFGDDWKKVAHHVGGRSEKECVSQFIKLHFADEYVDDQESMDIDSKSNPLKDQSDVESGAESSTSLPPNKRIRLTPLGDASNPIMSQAAFLSALTGVEVAEAAAEAAVRALSEVEYGISGGSHVSSSKSMKAREAKSSTHEGSNLNPEEAALVDANSVLEKEEVGLERAISEIAEVQTKEIHEKIVNFEELDLLMEKERQQLEQMKNQLFIDQLSLLLHKHPTSNSREGKEEK